ncbi:hypothetical protein CPLU01_15360 [Colletotrichum plurivorum]|uniref:NACHT-NTPase and P-loop NTPases N-terminal domain-containing protein n=1 Tax=Colletotrichum plurivorum TaxID=2175906 RepID=A0A8H6JBW9_9PEZI|nr:hypothetical protein CPLU01_15360 [Colletotrichum plurivorum]
MSSTNIPSHITAAIQGISFCIQAYDTIRDTDELPIAFQAVSEGLPLAHNTLTLAAEQATASNASPQDLEVVRSTMDATRKKTRELESIMRKIRDSRLESGESSTLLAYQSIVLKLGGKDHAVEALMREVLLSVKELSSSPAFLMMMAEQIRRVEEAIDRLAAMEPSYKDERPVSSRDSFHAGGDINANTGTGVYYNMKGRSRIGNVGNGGTVKNSYHGTGPDALVTGSDSDSD